MNLAKAGWPAPARAAMSDDREIRRLGTFLCVGVLGLATDASVFSGLYDAGLSLALARAVSLLCATGVTWHLNRLFTFAASGRRPIHEVLRYGLVALGAQGFSYGFFLTATRALPGVPNLGVLVIGAALATALSFSGQRFFTFRAARYI